MTAWPHKVANDSTEFFKGSFKHEGWDGHKWPNRKNEPRSGKRAAKGQRGLLIRSGDLKDSIEAVHISSRKVEIEAGYDVGKRTKYDLATIHNEGLKPNPKRQFMGKSLKLDRRVMTRLKKDINRVIKAAK